MTADSSVEKFAALVASDGWHLDEACLLIGGVDPAPWLRELDSLAESVSDPEPGNVVGTLFGSGRWTGNSVDFYNADNCYLHRVIERRLGMPILLSILAMEVGRRIGTSFVGIALPSHFVIADESGKRYFDPFHLGREMTARDCRLLVRAMSGSDEWHDHWLRPATNDMIVQRVLLNLKGISQRSRQFGVLQRVMMLRMAFPALAASESAELRRVMARFN